MAIANIRNVWLRRTLTIVLGVPLFPFMVLLGGAYGLRGEFIDSLRAMKNAWEGSLATRKEGDHGTHLS